MQPESLPTKKGDTTPKQHLHSLNILYVQIDPSIVSNLPSSDEFTRQMQLNLYIFFISRCLSIGPVLLIRMWI
ncbi:hypothetical protein BDV28DRAFT_138152 [Aspergillus coremiiformis]|uniref:Uncharacterized protein n=1 Tax=Aspergillus coremiiformis TaxID=138285 RepID=A0A5N6YZV7_9EURO|nr:hypothetical protein BDV28DRAFT_138152 [Aspergillus coremiiformis]